MWLVLCRSCFSASRKFCKGWMLFDGLKADLHVIWFWFGVIASWRPEGRPTCDLVLDDRLLTAWRPTYMWFGFGLVWSSFWRPKGRPTCDLVLCRSWLRVMFFVGRALARQESFVKARCFLTAWRPTYRWLVFCRSWLRIMFFCRSCFSASRKFCKG